MMLLWTTLLVIGIFVVFAYLMTRRGGGCCGGHNQHEGPKEHEGHMASGDDNKSTRDSCCGI